MILKKIFFLFLIFSLFSFQTLAIEFKFPGVKLKPFEVCGKSNCRPGNSLGTIFAFSVDLFAPEINDTITEEEVVLSVVGQTIKKNDVSGSTPIPCSSNGVSPFTKEDITKMGVKGYKVKFEKKATLNLTIDSAVEANMKEIKKVETDPLKLKKAEAKIKLAYEKINKKEFKVTATYTEWGLKANVINLIRVKNNKYKECRDYLDSNTNRLITAIGLVSYDMNYAQNSVSKLASEIQSQVESELGIKASFSFTFKKEVTKDLIAEVEDGYSIAVWEHSREKVLK